MGLGAPQIVVTVLLSILGVIVGVFAFKKFVPILLERRRRIATCRQASPESTRNFIQIDEEKNLEKPEVRQTFLYLDSASEKSSKKRRGLGIDVHPGVRLSIASHTKRKHRSRGHDFFDTSSAASITAEDRHDAPPVPTSMPYTPQDYTPRGRTYYSPDTPPSTQVTESEVSVSPKNNRPLPTPTQRAKRSLRDPDRHDISPMHTATTLPRLSSLPMSFLGEINAKREDQTGRQTVSPVLDSPTPAPLRKFSDSQLSSRAVSPISAPSATPVITYPNATPVYLPRPISKYNPYRPALEPASSKNWPLDNVAIPGTAAIRGPGGISPVRKHLSQSPLRPAGSTSRSPTPTSSRPSMPVDAIQDCRVPEAIITHPELDDAFLADFHRQRHQRQKIKEEAQKIKQKGSKGEKSRGVSKSPLRQSKKSTKRGIPPNPADEPNYYTLAQSPEPAGDASPELSKVRPLSAIRRAITAAVTLEEGTTAANTNISSAGSKSRPRTSPSLGISRRKHSDQSLRLARPSTADKKKSSSKTDSSRHQMPPPVPSKSRKPSQKPEAYEQARRVSGIHELVGSVSSTPVPGSPVVSEAASAHSRRTK